MGELVQMASQMGPSVQKLVFEGVQGMAPKIIEEGGKGLVSIALSSIRRSSTGSLAIGVLGGASALGLGYLGYLCNSQVNAWLGPILENTDRLVKESEERVNAFIHLEEKCADETEILNKVIETLVLEKEGIRKILDDQVITNETLSHIATELKAHSSVYEKRIDNLVALAIKQGALADSLAEVIEIRDNEGSILHAEIKNRLKAVNEIYEQLVLMFPC